MDADAPIAVLLVEDDEKLAQLTARYLTGHGLVVNVAHDGSEGLAAALKSPPDVVVLDVMLPGTNGMDVCRKLRERSDVPVIMLTARGEEADRVMGLELGADDYLAKPFSSRELLARVKAQVRRARGKAGPGKRLLRVGALTLDPQNLSASLDGEALSLTSSEFKLLQVLAERPGRVLSREQLLDLAHGSAEEAFDRSIDVQISRIRQKLEKDPKNPRLLKTVRGAGYMLATDTAE